MSLEPWEWVVIFAVFCLSVLTARRLARPLKPVEPAEPFKSTRRPNDPKFPPEVEADEMMREAILRAWRSDAPVFAQRDSQGNVTFIEGEKEA